MYHFPNQPLFHHNSQNDYQHYSALDHEKTFVPNVPVNYAQTQLEAGAQQSNNPVQSEVSSEISENVPVIETKISSMKTNKKTPVDTSNFTIEQRLVAAVWMHERKNTKSSISQIKQDFRQRFARDPPAKNTLMVWERKLFSTGSVHDAPRPGRPIKRSGGAAAVRASLRAAPALPLRARARALRLPRSTLRAVLRDLAPPPAGKPKSSIPKQSVKKHHLRPAPPEPTASLHFPQGYT